MPGAGPGPCDNGSQTGYSRPSSLSAMGIETVLFVCALFTAAGLFAVVRRAGRLPGGPGGGADTVRCSETASES